MALLAGVVPYVIMRNCFKAWCLETLWGEKNEMNQQEREKVIAELSAATGLACSYNDHDHDFVLFRRHERGIYRLLVIKERNPWVVAFGSKYEQARVLMRRILDDFNLSDAAVEIDGNTPRRNNAVWCRIRFFRDGGNWYNNRKQIISGASFLYKRMKEVG